MGSEAKVPAFKMEWLLTIVALLFLAYAYGNNYLQQEQLKKEGRITQGNVTDYDSDGKTFHVEYQFRVEGTRLTGAANIRYELHGGDPISILYLPSNPHINQPVYKDSSAASPAAK